MTSLTTHHYQTSGTLFGLLRHGITQWNEEKRIQGRKDSPLSEHGIMQTGLWGKELIKYDWQIILASDLGRVRQTVSLIQEHLPVPVVWDKRLREIDWGIWEGMKLEDVRRHYLAELSEQTQAGWEFCAPRGESRTQALFRAQQCLAEADHKRPEKRILIVCHLGIIKCLLYDILNKLFLPSEKNSVKKNCLHLVLRAQDRLTVKKMNIELDEE